MTKVEVARLEIDPEASGAPVFISYATSDKDTADRICAALESSGIRCWIAPRNVTPGAFYADAIVEAINAASVMIIVLSANSAGSQHVLREVERACAKQRALLAYRLDLTPLPTSLEYFLSASHWLDASAGTPEQTFPQLKEAVGHLLNPRERVLRATDNNAGGPQAVPSSWKGPGVIALIISVLALAIGSYLWSRAHTVSDASRVPPGNLPVASDERSVAVLPFADRSEKKDQEYISDGIAEEISDLLANIPELRVIGKNSAAHFKGNEDVLKVGRELGVAYLVQGSVRKTGDQLRISARLIRAADGSQIWAENYDDYSADIITVQDRITSNVVRALQISMDVGEQRAPQERRNPEAYNLYLRGKHELDSFQDEDLQRAIEYFQHALDLDPSFVRALEMLATAEESQAEVGWVPPTVGFERAKQTIERGLQLKQDSAALISLRALIHAIYDWDWIAAVADSKRALALEPHNALVLENVGEVYIGVGPLEEATRLFNAALAVDPLDSASHYYLGTVRYAAGRLPEAEKEFRKFLNLSPGGPAHVRLGMILLDEGHTDQALAEMKVAGASAAMGTAMAYYAMGRMNDCKASLSLAIKEHADDDAFSIAQTYAYLGDAPAVFMWLDRAYRQKEPSLFQIKVLPPFNKVKADPRWNAFLHTMNFSE